MSLRVKLMLSYVLLVTFTLVSVVLIARAGAVREVGFFMTSQGMVGEDELVNDLEAFYADNGGWAGVEDLLAAGRMMGRQRIVVADGNGEVVADTRGRAGEILTRLQIASAARLRGPDGELAGYLLAEAGAVGNMMGGIASQAGSNLLRRLTNASLTAAVIGWGLAVLIALVLGYQMLRPVGALIRAVRGMARGDLSQRVEARGTDELSELGRAFNQMAETLQKSEQNRRSMTADIAHELRTPVAVQRAHLEALQDGVYALTPENLQPVIDQTELLVRLVEDLRTLALADAGELKLERAAVQPADMARRVVERFRPVADGQGIDLRLVMEDGPLPEVWVDEKRIEQVLNNLVGNALRYTPAGGQVVLQVKSAERRWVVRVLDSGPGIPAEALPHIFERFYRADHSRSRAEGGTGLGLAIARQLAEAHGGELRAENRPEGGAAFTLELPIES